MNDLPVVQEQDGADLGDEPQSMSELPSDHPNLLRGNESRPTDILKRSLALRMPVFERGTAAKVKLDSLEEYMLLTAFTQGELSEERDRCIEELEGVEARWDDVKGDSYHLGKPVKSGAALDRERKDEDPGLWRDRNRLKGRIARLSGEIERMERDAKVCSRAYSFITGS